MQALAPGITVNRILISPEEINAEVQYHPADNLYDAKYEAMKALVIRELLIQRAAQLGLCTRDKGVKKPDEVIDALLEKEISIPEADEETCLRYNQKNKRKFFTSPLFEVSHILYLAPPGDKKAGETALKKAQAALKKIKDKPELFEALAREESACSSASEGGRLGQISKGQTMPAFEAALFQMKENEISPQPVATEVGYHIIKVHKKAEGLQLPFETAHEWIRDDLTQKSWNQAFNQYIKVLAGKSEISGFHLEGSKTPLVQ